MNRRHFIVSSSSAAVAGLALARVPAWAQQPAAAAPPLVTKFEEIRRGVGIFTATGGTIAYLINGAGTVVVDSQYMPNAEACIAGLAPRTPKGIELLINTHHHGDHTGGNAAFRPLVKRIVAQENCLAWHKRVAEGAGTTAQQAFADLTFGESWSQEFGDEKVWARHLGPGHTSGDAVIFFEKANLIHGGDLLFRRVHPRIDGPAGASAVNWVRILDQLIKAYGDDTAFVFGHGLDGAVRGTRADVVFFRDYLTAAVEHVRKAKSSGASRDEVAKTSVLKGFESVGQVSPRLTLGSTLESIYDELSKA